jgi:hypothetical protein
MANVGQLTNTSIIHVRCHLTIADPSVFGQLLQSSSPRQVSVADELNIHHFY